MLMPEETAFFNFFGEKSGLAKDVGALMGPESGKMPTLCAGILDGSEFPEVFEHHSAELFSNAAACILIDRRAESRSWQFQVGS